jgi:hypothetical protein
LRIVVRTILLFVLFLKPFAVHAEDLELKLLGGKKKEVDAGTNINVMVMVTNKTNIARNFQIKLSTQGDGWKFLSDYSSNAIGKNANVNRIVGIHIPNNIQAGDNTIEIEAIDNESNVSFGKIQIPISISVKYNLEIDRFKSPHFLFSGDTLSTLYQVRNLSNCDVNVRMKLTDGQISKNESYFIKKDSSILYRYFVSVPKKLDMYTQRLVVLNAEILDKPDTEIFDAFPFEIFPTDIPTFDPYIRFPVKVTGLAAATNRMGGFIYSTMYDIQAMGPIGDASKKQTLEIHLRGPDRTGNPLFGLNDEYYLKFLTPKVEFAVGDNNYGLSDLTESSRNGQGIRLQYNFKKLSFGGFYNHPKYFPELKHVFSAYTCFAFDPLNQFKFGLLSKIDTTNKNVQLLTLSSNVKPFSWLTTNLEAAVGQRGSSWSKAYQAYLQLSSSFVTSSINYTYADVDFPGFVRNTKRLYTGLSLNLKSFSISLSYNYNSSNLALDTIYSNSPITQGYSVSTNFKLAKNHSLSLGAFSSSSKDQSVIPLFDYSKYSGRLSVQSLFGPLSVSLQGDAGKVKNYLQGNLEMTDYFSTGLNLGLKLTKFLTASGNLNYQGGLKGITGMENIYYSGILLANLNERLTTSLQYNSNFEWQYYTSDRSLFSLDLRSNINKNNQISIGANYNLVKNSLDTKEYGIQMRYTHTFNLPISRRKDMGTLSGKLINHGVDKIGGVRLNLNGYITITDKEGNFKFPAVPIGIQSLVMDESSFGLNVIPEIAGPFLVNIQPSKSTFFELAMTKSARIEGRIVVQEDLNSKQKGYIQVKDQIDKLVVEASCGTEVFRVLTNRDGIFKFEDLRPGKWQVKVFPNGLPQGYQLLTPQFNLLLTSGKDEKLEVQVQKKARQVHIQSTFK